MKDGANKCAPLRNLLKVTNPQNILQSKQAGGFVLRMTNAL